jgi:polyphosphate kinase
MDFMESLEANKLMQLRAKTDRQLLDFLHYKLETGLNCAASAAKLYSDGTLLSAELALNEVQMLLPVLTEKQRRELDPKLNILREALNRLTQLRDSAKSRAATSIW